jgi:hypothetical protein
LKHIAFENNNNSAVLDGIICIYVYKNKDIPGHMMKAYKGRRTIALVIPNLSNRQE